MYRVEKELIQNLTEGSKIAFTQIFDEHWEQLHNIAYNRLKSDVIADDLVQNVFTELWINRSRIEIKKSLRAYLIQCIKHKIYNHIRYQSVRQRIEFTEIIYRQFYDHHEDYYSDSEIVCSELNSIFNHEIESLPEKTKTIFRLSRLKNYSYQEIAEHCNCSTKNVEYHISKALSTLNLRLQRYNS